MILSLLESDAEEPIAQKQTDYAVVERVGVVYDL